MSKTEFQVLDTRTKMPVPGCQSMMILCMAQDVAQKLNRRYKTPRYSIIRVDPNNLPIAGTDPNPADIVSEFADA